MQENKEKLKELSSLSAPKLAFFKENSDRNLKEIEVNSLTLNDIKANAHYYKMKEGHREVILINGETVVGRELIEVSRKKMEEKIQQLDDKEYKYALYMMDHYGENKRNRFAVHSCFESQFKRYMEPINFTVKKYLSGLVEKKQQLN